MIIKTIEGSVTIAADTEQMGFEISLIHSRGACTYSLRATATEAAFDSAEDLVTAVAKGCEILSRMLESDHDIGGGI
jgi:hypothetical protein